MIFSFALTEALKIALRKTQCEWLFSTIFNLSISAEHTEALTNIFLEVDVEYNRHEVFS